MRYNIPMLERLPGPDYPEAKNIIVLGSAAIAV